MKNCHLGVIATIGALALGLVGAQATPPKNAKPAPPKHAAAPAKPKKVVHHHARAKRARRHVVRHKVRHKVHHEAMHMSGGGAEDALAGIHLYDTNMDLLNVYGSPDLLQPLALGGGGGGGKGFGGGSGGFGGAPGRGAGAPPGAPGLRGLRGGGGPPGLQGGDWINPEGFSEGPVEFLPPGGVTGGGGGGGGGGQGPGRGLPGMGNKGRGGGGGTPGGGGGAATTATYLRWIYNRNDNKLGFVVDPNGRIIEIEAIGLTNPRVMTKRGVTFGTDFATILRRYHQPDGYDIGGDNLTLRYLVHDKVAFKLTRLAPGKPHQVTGIVVAAGTP